MNVILILYAISDVYQLESYARIKQHIQPYFYIPHYTLLSGDFLNPLPYTAFDSGRTVIKALNLLPVDIVTFGNHDIEDNTKVLNEVLDEDLNTVYISTNIKGIEKSIPYHIIQEKNLKLGIIGLCDDTFYTKSKIEFYDKNVVVRNNIEILIKNNVDYIIALTHNDPEVDYALIDKFPEIDLILSGHIHEYSYLNYKNVPIIRTGENVETLAEISFHEDKSFSVDFTDISNVKQHVSYNKLISDGKEMLKSFEGVSIFYLKQNYNLENLRNRENLFMKKLCELVKSYFNSDFGIINAGLFRLKRKEIENVFSYSDFNLAFPFDNPFMKFSISGKLLNSAIEYANKRHYNQGGFIHRTDGFIENDREYTIALNGLIIDGMDENPFFEQLKPININEGISIRSILLEFRNLEI